MKDKSFKHQICAFAGICPQERQAEKIRIVRGEIRIVRGAVSTFAVRRKGMVTKMGALFGPGGNSEDFYAAGKKHTYQAPEWLREYGLDAYEYQAGHGLSGSVETFKKIGREAKENSIKLSLHAPYFISLSGEKIETRLKSIDYISASLDAAEIMGGSIIVVHSGSAGKISRPEAMNLAKDTLYKTLEKIPGNGVKIGLETMGKLNQLGTLDEVIELCGIDKRLRPVVDFGHLYARSIGEEYILKEHYRYVFDKIGDKLGGEYAGELHCHFSMIEYTKSGEKKHLTFGQTEYGPRFEPLMKVIAADGLSPTIICESAGSMAADALTMKKYYRSLFSAQ